MEINEIMELLGLTPAEVARITGVSYMTAWRWTKGRCKPSRLAEEQLKKLEKEAQRIAKLKEKKALSKT